MNDEKRPRPGRPPNHPPVKNFDTGETYKTYVSAAKAINGNRYGIYRCCIGIQRKHKGYHFGFE
jgi:hypothetical protein